MDSENTPGDEFPFFDLGAMLGGIGSGREWETARNVAASVASNGESEPNVDPLARREIESLVRVAELQVADQLQGVLPSPDMKISVVTRGEWARRSVEVYRPFFERFGEAIGDSEPLVDDPSDPFATMLGQMLKGIAPMMVSATAGTMLGHLGQRALGQYELPVPRHGTDILIVSSTVDRAAAEWGVGVTDLRLWILVHEMVTHTVLSVPHVAKRLESLLLDFASAFKPNLDQINDQFGSMTDLSQLQELSETFSEPTALLSMMKSGAHGLLMPQLDAMVAIIIGFVEHTVDRICGSLVPSSAQIKEHFRNRWSDSVPSDRFTEELLGLNITTETFNRGDQFITGIRERAGVEALDRLWADELDLPTAAEVNAPGLWVERVGLDPDFGPAVDQIPDDLSGLE